MRHDCHDQLLDPQGVGKEGVFSGLSILGDASLEISYTGSDNAHTAVSLGGSSDHVLDEVTVTGGIDDSDIVLGSLELPQGDVNGDATLTLSLQFVQHSSILEVGQFELEGTTRYVRRFIQKVCQF